MYSDADCTNVTSSTALGFEDVTAEVSTSMIADTTSSCLSCMMGDDVTGYCTQLYEASYYKCEAGWSNYQHYYYDDSTEIYRYGRDESGCRYVDGDATTGNPSEQADQDRQRRNRRHRGGQKARSDWTEVLFIATLVSLSIASWVCYNSWWERSKYLFTHFYNSEQTSHFFRVCIIPRQSFQSLTSSQFMIVFSINEML